MMLSFGSIQSAKALPITANSSVSDTIQLAVCAGERLDGIVLYQDTVWVDTLYSSLHCDSLLVKQISVFPVVETHTTVEICENVDQFDAPIAGRGEVFIDSLQTIHGCDSIVYTELIINYHTTEFQLQNICPSDTFFVGDTPYTEQGLYVDTLHTYQNCDSVVVTFLLVSNPIYETLLIDICKNEAYMGQFFEQDTVLIDTMPHIDGCPKIVYTLIDVHQTAETILSAQIQEGDLYNNELLLEIDTVIIDSLLTIHGCDSIVKTYVQILPRFFSSFDVQLCQGVPYKDVLFDENTILIDTLESSIGTDSIVQTNIEVLLADTTWIETHTCIASEAGLYETQFENQFGCDSLVYTKIDFLEAIQTEEQVEFCINTIYKDLLLTQDTSFLETHIAANGCDSLHRTHINVLPLPDARIEGATSFCKGDSIALNIGDFENCIWSTGEQSNNIYIMTAGTYYVTVTDTNHCSHSSQIEILPAIELQAQIRQQGVDCTQAENQLLVSEVTGGTAPYLFSLAGENYQHNPVFESITAGEHRLLIEDINGCQLDTLVQVEALAEQYLAIEQAIDIQLGADQQIHIETNAQDISQVVWSPTTGLSCSDCLEPIASPLESTNYQLTIYTDSGCVLHDQIQLRIDAATGIFIPNAFSPNGDNHNDSFTIYAGQNVNKVLFLSIYDRWGNKIFENRDFEPNNPSKGWKGDIPTQQMQSSVYTYNTEIELINKKTIALKGDITIIR